MNKTKKLKIRVFICFICTVLAVVGAQAIAATILPEVKTFIEKHPGFGKTLTVEDMPDWAYGKRQQIKTQSGRYLFYIYEEEVVDVYEYLTDGTRKQIFHKDISELPADVNRKASEDLPAYVILDQFKLITGGKYGDVLVKSFSKDTPQNIVKTTLLKIAEKEGFTQACLYCTEEAYKANSSSSYLKQHPNALKEGLLGTLIDGQFYYGIL